MYEMPHDVTDCSSRQHQQRLCRQYSLTSLLTALLSDSHQFGRVVFETCGRTDRRTDALIAILRTSYPYCGEVIIETLCWRGSLHGAGEKEGECERMLDEASVANLSAMQL